MQSEECRSAPGAAKTLILALGNPILCDDGVAWEIADLLGRRLPAGQFDIMKESGATLDLLHRFAGYERLAVIDAIQLGTASVGTVHRFSLSDFESSIRYSSAHDINFATAFAVGRKYGYEIPDDIRIYGIEVKELRRFGEGLTPGLQSRLGDIVDELARELWDLGVKGSRGQT